MLVVHAADGLDEISLSGDTYVAELPDGQISEYTLNPQQFGLKPSPTEKLVVHNINEATTMLRQSLGRQSCAARDIVALNAGAALYVSGVAASLEEGHTRAQALIQHGAAGIKLNALIAFSRQFIPSP